MAGIYISGMEMPPEGTFNIVHIHSDGRVAIPCWGKGMQVVQGIEAVPVPPHGRLGDLDELYRRIKAECNPYGNPTISYDDGLKVLGIIGSTPPIIPPSEEAHDEP